VNECPKCGGWMSWTILVKQEGEFEDVLDEDGKVDGEKLRLLKTKQEAVYECDDCGYIERDS
jgi:uncharacterized Zn finger protein